MSNSKTHQNAMYGQLVSDGIESIPEVDKRGTFMIVSGYTVMMSGITSFSKGVSELRKMHWLSPAPKLVKVICNAQEI